MTRLVKLFLLIVACGLVVGAGVGALIGAISPGFLVRMLAPFGTSSPVQDGIALGLANGSVLGVLGGSVLVIAVAIAERGAKEGIGRSGEI